MRIVGVLTLGMAPVFDSVVQHGTNPHLLLWRRGWVIIRLLSARLDDGNDVVITAIIRKRTSHDRPPRVRDRHRRIDDDLPKNNPVLRQRLAAYGVVTSSRGLLGTQLSDRTYAPGVWQLPGGGLEVGETPADAFIREAYEEAGQLVTALQLVDLQSDHWIGLSPLGEYQDFHALRLIYRADCPNPTDPVVHDLDGTTQSAHWVPLNRWRDLQWTGGAHAALQKHASRSTR